MTFSTSSPPAIYCATTLTLTDSDILAAGSYYIAAGVALSDPVAIASTPVTLIDGQGVWLLDFGTDEAVALFASATRDGIPVKIWVLDTTDAPEPPELIGKTEVSLWWAPEPDGYLPVALGTAASQAWVTAAIAAHAALADPHSGIGTNAGAIADHIADTDDPHGSEAAAKAAIATANGGDITFASGFGPVITDTATGAKYRMILINKRSTLVEVTP